MKILNYYNDWKYSVNSIFLHKDFGLISYTFGKVLNRQVDYLISNNSDNNISFFFNQSVYSSKKIFHPKHFLIDLLNLIHPIFFLFKRKNQYSHLVIINFVVVCDYFFVYVFKILNKKSTVVLKLDTNYSIIQNRFNNRNNGFLKKVEYNYFLKLLRSVDVILYENQDCEFYLKDNTDLRQTVSWVPNGVSSDLIQSHYNIPWRHINERSNNVLIIGNFSIPKKNIKWLTDNYCHKFSELKKWKFYFICGKNINVNYENIFFIDNLSKNDIYTLFSNSKILLNVSNNEGFPISFAEGIFFGLNLYSTNVGGASYYKSIHTGSFISDNPKSVVDKLVNDLKKNDLTFSDSKNFYYDISWEKILSHIL